jgi:alcohol dehydrogenase class IV
MLPHVMRFNEAVTRDKQKLIAHALGRPELSAADAVADLVRSLGQPASLRAVGVKRDQLPAIAEASMKNLWVRTNPQPIRSPEDVMRLLQAAW